MESNQFSRSLGSDDLGLSRDPKRRAASRIQTIMRIGRVVTDRDEGLARIRNISDQGVSLRLLIPVMLGDILALELGEGLTVTGQVVWTSGSDCGLRFDQDIDCGEMLTRLAASSVQGRPMRLSVATPALTRGENGLRQIEITDVSQRGIKLKHDGSFTEGLKIKITLPSGRERLGVVRWSKDNFAGVLLLEPFSAEDLGSTRNL